VEGGWGWAEHSTDRPQALVPRLLLCRRKRAPELGKGGMSQSKEKCVCARTCENLGKPH